MGGLQNLVYFAIFLGVLVTIHEAGHFFAAKWAGVKVLTFSIGFGPALFGFTRKETRYQVSLLPLGGYVRLAGDLPGDEEAAADPREREGTFFAAPWWKRAIIKVAGPAFNFIFPVLAYWVLFLGDHQVVAPRVGWVEPDLPAAHAGVLPGDVITRVDGHPIREFAEIREQLDGKFDREIPLTVLRDGHELTLRITPQKNVEDLQIEKVARGLLGVTSVARPAIIGVKPGSVAAQAGLQTFDRLLTVNGEAVRDEVQLKKLLSGLTGTLTVVVVRSHLTPLAGTSVVVPELVTLTVEKQPGEGFEAVGAESGDLYVWTVFPKSPAQKAGLKRGDRLTTIDGKVLGSYFTVLLELKALEKQKFTLGWVSDGEAKSVELSQVSHDELDELKNHHEVLELGVRPRPAFQGAGELLASGPESEKLTITLGPLEALQASLRTVPEAARAILLAFGKMATGDLPADSFGGPILLFQIAAKSAEAGVEVFVRNMAVISVNLGLVNLFPIPILDGYGLLEAFWEGIRRRRISDRAREVSMYLGLAMIAALMVFVFKNDISRQFNKAEDDAPAATRPTGR
jgi:regulator of sigma E protease